MVDKTRRLLVFGSLLAAGGFALHKMGATKKLGELLDFESEDGTDLPSVTEALTNKLKKPSVVVDNQGDELFEYRTTHEKPFKHFDDIPPALIQALLTSEDKEFFTRPGVRDEWMTKARWALKGRGGSTIEMQLGKSLLGRTGKLKGGSEKKREILMAQKVLDFCSKLETRKELSKPGRLLTAKEIVLGLYINTVTFAENTIGFRAAAQTFFSKDEKDMTMDEWATLVVMLQANTAYNPLRGKKQKSACKTERNTVISHLSDPVIINGSGGRGRMYSDGEKISMRAKDINTQRGNLDHLTGLAPHLKSGALHDELVALLQDSGVAKSLGLDIVKVDDEDRQNPDYKGMSDDKILEHKRTHLADLIDSQLPLLGLEIETTLDAKAQKIAEATFHTEMEKMRNDGNMKMEGVKGSVLITSNKEENPASIVAWVGGDNFKEDQVDWVEAKRQVGSMMKELVYAVAMEQGIISDINSTKYTSLRDGQEYDLIDQDGLEWNSGAPGAPSSPVRNSDRKYVGGPITWAEAFRESKNTAVWHLWNAGILEHVIKKLEDSSSGFAMKFNRVKGSDGKDLDIVSPSELIGGGSSFSTLQMARIHFSVINGRAPDRFQMITRIKTKEGKTRTADKPEEKEFWPDGVRRSMHGLLQNTVRGKWGGKYDKAKFVFGGKTGTATVADPITGESKAGDLGFNGSAGKYNIMVRAGHKNPAPTGTDAPSSVRRVAFTIAEKMHTAGLIQDGDTSFVANLEQLEVEEGMENGDSPEGGNESGFDNLDEGTGIDDRELGGGPNEPAGGKTAPKPAPKPASKPVSQPKPTTGFDDL